MKNRLKMLLDKDPQLSRMVAWSRENVVKCEARPERGELLIMGPILDAETAEFYRMYGLESGVDDKSVYNELQRIEASEVDVVINSPGGDAWTGISIMNILKMSPKTIRVKVTGQATSAASVVAMAGDTITMGVGSTMMIHRAWTCACGNAIDMAQLATMLETVDGNLTDVYVARTGLDREKILGMLHPDTYMSAQEAVDLGFADGIADFGAEKQEQPAGSSARAVAFGNFFLGRR